MKNYRTPRTLADCEFLSGYPVHEQLRRSNGLIRSIVLACLIGGGLGWWLVHSIA